MTTPQNQSVRLAQGISTYFVPGIRLRKLPAQLAAASQPGTGLDADVIADILRAEVTLVSSGAAQYSITFNNWYASTATDRAGSKPAGLRGAGHRQRRGRPEPPQGPPRGAKGIPQPRRAPDRLRRAGAGQVPAADRGAAAGAVAAVRRLGRHGNRRSAG